MKIINMEELIAFLNQPGVSVSTPQFERTDGVVPVLPEGGAMWFDKLKGLSHETLKAVGMGVWEPGHYLYPAEWYDFIPEGYVVTDIFGEEKPFERGVTEYGKRYGVLPYGFRTPEWIPEDVDTPAKYNQ